MSKRNKIRKLQRNHYQIQVVQTVLPTYAELCGGYSHVSYPWTPDGPAPQLHESLRGITPPVGEVVLFLKASRAFNALSTEDMIAWALKNGYRPVFPWEREAFRKVAPRRVLLPGLIVDLGTFAPMSGEQRYFPIFGDDEAILGSNMFRPREWNPKDRFLFAVK